MAGVSRKVVPDKGSLNRERPATKALKFPSCTKKVLFSSSPIAMEDTRDAERGWQVWLHGTVKETVGYFENYPFFDWQPVRYIIVVVD